MRPRRNQVEVHPHLEVAGVVHRAVVVAAHYRGVEVRNHNRPVPKQEQDTTLSIKLPTKMSEGR